MGLRGGSARRTGDTSPGKSLPEGGDKRSAFLELLSAEHPKAVKQVHRCQWTMPVLRRASSAACAALDHVANKAMFNCDTELLRWSVFGFFCAKFLSFSELPFELGSLAFNVSD